ncbi:hypothetical protein AVEN_274933-1 [Araneus ventricosus]|uniref:Uncharacterized protein n=1 Tax=Araneus ventricosus TaxID=182803 RepID=A0A4Y2MSD9_ARAVE|nr:hypothetical protein AVEN_274933-1 [Araneus ventricosus]
MLNGAAISLACIELSSSAKQQVSLCTDELWEDNINNTRGAPKFLGGGVGNPKGKECHGHSCRRFKKNGIEAKRALTPIKVDAVQNGLRFWLSEHQKKEEQEVLKLASTSTVRNMLSDKIMDLSKQQKNNL